MLNLLMIGTLFWAVVFMAFYYVVMWQLFKKMGEKPWKSLIPVYSKYIIFKKVWQGEKFMLYLIPLIIQVAAQGMFSYFIMTGSAPEDLALLNILMYIGSIAAFLVEAILSRYVAAAFGQEYAFSFGLLLLPIVFYPMLAFGKAQYIGDFNNIQINK